MNLKSKALSDASWKDVVAKNKLKDNGLLKALERLKRLGDDDYAEADKTLDEIGKLAAALKKDKAAAAAAKHLGEMLDAVDAAQRDVAKAKAEHDKAQKAKAEAEKKAAAKMDDEDEDEDDEEESPELLTTKLKPLLKLVAKGETMHALVAKSGKQVVFMLSRKPIPPARRKMLADQLGGGSTKYYPGTCGLEAGATTFALKAEVAGMSKLVKAAVLAQTGLRLNKLKCRGEDGDDEDSDDDDKPAVVSGRKPQGDAAEKADGPAPGEAPVADKNAQAGPTAPADLTAQAGPTVQAGPDTRAPGTQGPREKTEGQGEFIGSKGVLVFDFAPDKATLTPNQERVLMSQQVKFSTRGARLRIVGHSSAEEDASVSQKRADAVAAFLRAGPKHAVPDANILEAKGVGATRPIAPEGDKGKVNEANRKRNRSVEVVMTTAGDFVGGGGGDVDVDGVGKDAPAVHHEPSDAVGYADIAASIVAGALELTALAFVAEFVGPAAMLAHIALAQEEARAAKQRMAYADGVRNCADAAREFIAKHHASVAYGDVESSAMPKIDDMTYYPAESWQAKQAASMGIKSAVDAFDPAMRRTEAFVRDRLAAKGLKGPELQKVFDKIIGDMRNTVAYALADALKAKARELRRG